MIFRFRIQTMHEISKLTFHQAFVYTRLPLLYPVPWFMPFAKLHSKDFKTQANTKKTPHVLKQNRQTARLVPKDHDQKERINSKTADSLAESKAQKMLKSIKPSPSENISQSTWPCPLTAPIPKLQHLPTAYGSRRQACKCSVLGFGFRVHSNQGPRFQG